MNIRTLLGWASERNNAGDVERTFLHPKPAVPRAKRKYELSDGPYSGQSSPTLQPSSAYPPRVSPPSSVPYSSLIHSIVDSPTKWAIPFSLSNKLFCFWILFQVVRNFLRNQLQLLEFFLQSGACLLLFVKLLLEVRNKSLACEARQLRKTLHLRH